MSTAAAVRYTGFVRAGPNRRRQVPAGEAGRARRQSIFQSSPRQDRSRPRINDHARPTRPPRNRGLPHHRRDAPRAGQGLRSTADWRPKRAARAEEPAGGRAGQLRAPGRLYGKSFRVTGREDLFLVSPPPSSPLERNFFFSILASAPCYFTFLSSPGKIRGSVRGEFYYDVPLDLVAPL